MDRDSFLAGIRQSLQTTWLPSARPERPLASLPAEGEPERLIAQFTREIETLSGAVELVTSEEAALARIGDIFADHQAADYMAWADQFLPYEGLNEKLVSEGYRRVDSFVPGEGEDRQAVLERLSEVPVGMTGALAGIAETGSLVLRTGPGRGRLTSLLPPVHICLLNAGRLYGTMAHFIQAFPDSVRQTSNLVFITGPSRTADIEQTLTLGVHGPGHLYVLLVA